MRPLVEIENVTKRFGSVAAVDRVSFGIGEGEFFALLGPSGCGKTSLMRLIAGFEAPDEGRISIGGRDMRGEPPYARPVNMMFQSYALFPHMSVARNIGFGLVQAAMGRSDIQTRVNELLRLVRLEGLGERKPDQLSGGQRQRVALARALARRPRLLLLDEPLAALDRKLREETQFELMRLQRELGTSFLLVTHDQDEAMAMASRIAVMRAGRLEQIGAPQEIYDHPANRFVAGFIGDANLFEAVVEDVRGTEARLALDGGGVVIATAPTGVCVGQKVVLSVRLEAVELVRSASPGGGSLAGEVVDIGFRGETSLVRLRLESGLFARASLSHAQRAQMSFASGDIVFAHFPAAAGRVLTS